MKRERMPIVRPACANEVGTIANSLPSCPDSFEAPGCLGSAASVAGLGAAPCSPPTRLGVAIQNAVRRPLANSSQPRPPPRPPGAEGSDPRQRCPRCTTRRNHRASAPRNHRASAALATCCREHAPWSASPINCWPGCSSIWPRSKRAPSFGCMLARASTPARSRGEWRAPPDGTAAFGTPPHG